MSVHGGLLVISGGWQEGVVARAGRRGDTGCPGATVPGHPAMRVCGRCSAFVGHVCRTHLPPSAEQIDDIGGRSRQNATVSKPLLTCRRAGSA